MSNTPKYIALPKPNYHGLDPQTPIALLEQQADGIYEQVAEFAESSRVLAGRVTALLNAEPSRQRDIHSK